MTDACPTCGRDRTLVGYRHHCVPVSSASEFNKVVEFNAAEFNKSNAEFNKPVFDRVAYQREYMRRKRAKARADREASV